MSMLLVEVDTSLVLNTINETRDATTHLMEIFYRKPTQLQVLHNLKTDLERVAKTFPIIDVVCKKALQEQH